MSNFQAKLSNSDDETWKEREAAVLALGAVAEGCLIGLYPHLNEVILLSPDLINVLKKILRLVGWCFYSIDFLHVFGNVLIITSFVRSWFLCTIFVWEAHTHIYSFSFFFLDIVVYLVIFLLRSHISSLDTLINLCWQNGVLFNFFPSILCEYFMYTFGAAL